MSSESDPLPIATAKDRALVIMASATVLGLLYVGREVLIPITLAFILSLLMAPMIRWLRLLGLGHTPSVLLGVLGLALFLSGLATVIGAQVVHMGRSLPQYEATIDAKVATLRAMTIGRMQLMQGEAGRMIGQLDEKPADASSVSADAQQVFATSNHVVPVEIRTPTTDPIVVIRRILASVWVPLQTAGIVLVVLVFVLLEHEALRDRFIRLAGGTDLRSTTLAINDAGERLSRFFLSQFAVNVGVGAVIWLGLVIIGLPNAPLWATLTIVLRFVPYVGVWLVAVLATTLAAAVSPGWSLLLMTGGLYVAVELIASQLVEPQLYGHNTGLSPLAVVVAAIFWSWLWGPIGLIVSTPLTLCLVVAGRHVAGLNLLAILLGDMPALTMPQRFYQRALSGDSDEIIAGARTFLKRKTFAAYCDTVLLPALQLARTDMLSRVITPEQQIKVRSAIARVIESLGNEPHKTSRWHRDVSVLDGVNIGSHLRQRREGQWGRWQGPLAVAPGSVVICIGLGTMVDDTCTEILVRILRDRRIDARHLTVEDLDAFAAEAHPEATPGGVSMLYIVSSAPSKQRDEAHALATDMRSRFSGVFMVALLLPELMGIPELNAINPDVDQVARSFEEATQLAIARFPNGAPKVEPVKRAK